MTTSQRRHLFCLTTSLILRLCDASFPPTPDRRARTNRTVHQRKARTRIITERRLREFWERYPDAEKPLKSWRAMLRSKEYQTPHEVRADFASVDFLKGNVTVFDIRGNLYRLVVSMRYDLQKVFIRHIVTHKEYDELSADGLL